MKRKIMCIGMASLFVMITLTSLSGAEEIRVCNEPKKGDFLVIINYKNKRNGELILLQNILEPATVTVINAETQEVIAELDNNNAAGQTPHDGMYYFNLQKLGVTKDQELKVTASWKGETKTDNVSFDPYYVDSLYYRFERGSNQINKEISLISLILKNRQVRLFSILSELLKI